MEKHKNRSQRKAWRLARFQADTAGLLAFGPLRESAGYTHHGGLNTVESHCVRTAWCAYRLCRLFRVTREHEASAVQAALLHDLFGYNWRERPGSGKWLFSKARLSHAVGHGPEAVQFLKTQDVRLNGRQEDAIRKHMFPTYPVPPSFCEGWVLTAADKATAVKEFWLAVASRFGTVPKAPYVLRALAA